MRAVPGNWGKAFLRFFLGLSWFVWGTGLCRLDWIGLVGWCERFGSSLDGR